MRELAILATGVVIGLTLGGVCLLPTLVRLLEELGELAAAVDEWNEADRAMSAEPTKAALYHGSSVYRRLAGAQRTLRRLAEDAEV